jgi:hypothetical protein
LCRLARDRLLVSLLRGPNSRLIDNWVVCCATSMSHDSEVFTVPAEETQQSAGGKLYWLVPGLKVPRFQISDCPVHGTHPSAGGHLELHVGTVPGAMCAQNLIAWRQYGRTSTITEQLGKKLASLYGVFRGIDRRRNCPMGVSWNLSGGSKQLLAGTWWWTLLGARRLVRLEAILIVGQ